MMDNPEFIDDLASLTTLDEPQLLEAIRGRFLKDKIYTYIGDILVAVNPYKELHQYGPEYQKTYQYLSKRDDYPPHIYALAGHVYQNMLDTGQNQCCIVSGESGAGKTESTKYIVQQIAQLCHQDSSDLHQRIIMVNPLLEAFGNAQTVLNNNSSRFGKFIQLNFDRDGSICEAYIREYLLEKSRVVTQSLGEKNFHVFYYMFAGIPDYILKANKLANPDEHRIIKPIDGSPVFTSPEEKSEYKTMWDNLQMLFKVVGFKELEEQGLLATLAAILHLTDIVFIKDEQARDDSVLIKNEDSLVMASELLLVNCEELAKALISNVTILRHTGEKLVSVKNVVQANDGRDALAKALYGRLFAWTVRRVNLLLNPNRRRTVVDTKFVGILDLAGFENFRSNSFEQICINVANEQLHNFFNQYIFQWEMQEYQREGIQGKGVKFVDNTALLEMFTQPKKGFFAILDEQMKLPAPSNAKFLDQITALFKDSPNYQRPKGQTLKFVIHHYAGQVIYNCDQFLEKNRDTLNFNLEECMKCSQSDFICKLFYAELNDRGSMLVKITGAPTRNRTSALVSTVPSNFRSSVEGSRISVIAKNKTRQLKPMEREERRSFREKPATTIGHHFMSSLSDLLQKLRSGEPHFIRCIKPNTDKLPEVFQNDLVLQQLRYTGVLETVKIRQKGYATRVPFEHFIQRYGMLCPTPLQTSSSAEKCQQILKSTGLNEYEVGKTKVFLRYWHTEQLQIQLARIDKEVTKCQAYIRRFLAKRLLMRMKAEAERQKKEMRLLHQQVSRLSSDMYRVQRGQLEEDKRITKPPVLPVRHSIKKEGKSSGIEQPKPVLMTLAAQFIRDQLMDCLECFKNISQQVWAKLFYMENNELVAKIYLREWDIIINGSEQKYNGRVIGVNHDAFFNPLASSESLSIRESMGSGIELVKDPEGNILIRNLSKIPIIAKDYINPAGSCLGEELRENFGHVPNFFVKIFDIARFKQHIVQELHKQEMNIQRLRLLTVIKIALKNNCTDDFETSSWMFICNFAAMDLIGDEHVLAELLRFGGTPITPKRRIRLKNEWVNHRRQRAPLCSEPASVNNERGSLSYTSNTLRPGVFQTKL